LTADTRTRLIVTEFQVKDGWVPGFKLHVEKVTSAKLKEPKG
jgi:hypothetical protein